MTSNSIDHLAFLLEKTYTDPNPSVIENQLKQLQEKDFYSYFEGLNTIILKHNHPQVVKAAATNYKNSFKTFWTHSLSKCSDEQIDWLISLVMNLFFNINSQIKWILYDVLYVIVKSKFPNNFYIYYDKIYTILQSSDSNALDGVLMLFYCVSKCYGKYHLCSSGYATDDTFQYSDWLTMYIDLLFKIAKDYSHGSMNSPQLLNFLFLFNKIFKNSFHSKLPSWFLANSVCTEWINFWFSLLINFI